MQYTVTILKPKEYAEWKSGFDSEDGVALRKDSGMKSYQIFCADDDPNTVVLLAEWDNLDNARKHIQSGKIQQIHQQVGLPEMPETYYLQEVEKGSV
jgi:quinol monooxygenase YgiN